jgi:hypothetical protein
MSFIICGPSGYRIGVLAYYDRMNIIELPPPQEKVVQYHDGKKSATCLLFIKVKCYLSNIRPV